MKKKDEKEINEKKRKYYKVEIPFSTKLSILLILASNSSTALFSSGSIRRLDPSKSRSIESTRIN